MLDKGFEWSLQYGEPLNPSPMRYKPEAPCCKLAVDIQVVSCGHPWKLMGEFPKGEPLHGMPWKRGYPDPGTYTLGNGSDVR